MDQTSVKVLLGVRACTDDWMSNNEIRWTEAVTTPGSVNVREIIIEARPFHTRVSPRSLHQQVEGKGIRALWREREGQYL